ncbi:MAG TPA: GH25 family lysozyme, partial [Dehalococcoidia bacterium]|nr:GH25 family lysozyme [Dehalococcoidia bacterium]
MKAIDVSNWTGEISGEQARCLAGGGVELVICGTQAREIARQQIAAAVGAEMRVEAYVILRWPQTASDGSTGAQVRAARETIAGLSAGRLWVDCEQYLSLPTPPPGRTVEHIREAVAACDGMACGIYTSRYWWRTATGDTVEFAQLPLWDARYVARDGDPVPPFAPYGGWARAVMTQWRANVTVCGMNVDLDEREEVGMAGSEY